MDNGNISAGGQQLAGVGCGQHGYYHNNFMLSFAAIVTNANVKHSNGNSGGGGQVDIMATKRTNELFDDKNMTAKKVDKVQAYIENTEERKRHAIYNVIKESVAHFSQRYNAKSALKSIAFYRYGDFVAAVAKYANGDVINTVINVAIKVNKLRIDKAVIEAINEHSLNINGLDLTSFIFDCEVDYFVATTKAEVRNG